jgi:hypothetical protein
VLLLLMQAVALTRTERLMLALALALLLLLGEELLQALPEPEPDLRAEGELVGLLALLTEALALAVADEEAVALMEGTGK